MTDQTAITASVFTEDSEDEDLVVCQYAHALPVEIRGTGDAEEMSAEEVALGSGWLCTDDGWVCPDVAHADAAAMRYEVTPGPDESDAATCMNSTDVLDAVDMLLAEWPEGGAMEMQVTIKRSPSTIGAMRELFSEDESED